MERLPFVQLAILCCILITVSIVRVVHYGKHTRSLPDETPFNFEYYESDERDYETSGNSEKFDVTLDEGTDSDVLDVFDKRVEILHRGCSQLSIIQQLVDKRDYEALLKLHEEIYDRKSELNANRGRCTSPSFNDPKTSTAKYEDKRHTVNIFYEETLNLTICLPPKAGTTNWQNALAAIQSNHGRGTIPRLTNSDYTNPSNIADKTKLFALNARNPFQRLLSAWRDKFSINASPKRQQIYLPAIQVFEERYEVPQGYVSSFEAFIEYLAANPSEYSQNRHWRSIYYHCSPCHFPYTRIVHLESVDDEYPQIWKDLDYPPPTMRGQYGGSPVRHNSEELYYKNIPRNAVKQVYMNFYLDFVLLGYSPDIVKAIVKAADGTKEISEEDFQQSRELHGVPDQQDLNQVCY